MTQPYSIESVEERLAALGIPFSSHFARALVALLTVRKISLHQVTHLMPGKQNPEANRQQMRRCLDHENLTQEVWSRAIAALLPRDKWVLALDRTEWKRGDTTTNLLVLAVVVHGCSVPLLWTVMPDGDAGRWGKRYTGTRGTVVTVRCPVWQGANALRDGGSRIHRQRMDRLAAF